MKKIILGITALLSAFLLFSCETPDEPSKVPPAEKPDDTPSEEVPEINEDVIYSVKIQPNIICNEAEEKDDILTDIALSVFSTTYRTPGVFDDTKDESDHEIVVGETNRQISKKAYELLRALEHREGELSYLIYSNGRSVAIAYDNDIFGSNYAARFAADIICPLFNGDEEIRIPEGVLASSSFDIIEYQTAVDEEKRNAAWDALEKVLNDGGYKGTEIVGAIKEYYKQICTPDLVDWFAGLYDPYIGGYYFSNDARDNRGYLPDLESTGQALGFFESSGMFDYVEDDGSVSTGYYTYQLGLPRWMQEQMITFIKGLQDPETGFFYHPQWTKAMVDAKLSRRARDLSNAEGTLRYLGKKPTYNTPTGTKGDGILWYGDPLSRLTSALMHTDAAYAVSFVRPTATYASHLESDITFKEYLADLERQNASGYRTFYWIGNWIGSQVSQIQERDRQLAAEGKSYKLGDILIEWYTEHQNKETGLWDEGLEYENTNALLKIGGTYTSFGYVFPNADKALDSCLKMTMTDQSADAVVQVYNVWYAIRNLMENIEKLSVSDAEMKKAEEIRKQLRDGAPEAIRLTMEKQLRFKKADGGFSYVANENCVVSQGLPVAPAGDGEGDVNATIIVASGTINNCLRALGLYWDTPSYFGEAERMRYISILEERRPIVKNDIDRRTGGGGVTAGKYYKDYGEQRMNFDNTALSETGAYINTDRYNFEAMLIYSDRVLKIGHSGESTDSLWIPVIDKANGEGNCLVVEFDAKISGKAEFSDTDYREKDGGGISHFYKNVLSLVFSDTEASEMSRDENSKVAELPIYISDDTRNSEGAFVGGEALDFDSWLGGGSMFELDRHYNICIEFYEIDTPDARGQVEIKIYLDGVNVANQYRPAYETYPDGIKKPTDAKSFRIDLYECFKDADIEIDNIFAGIITKAYK